MIRSRWNEGWILNPVDGYEIFLNPDSMKKQQEVTLPFDALQLEKRSADVPMGRNTAFYPGAKCTYAKKFTVPEEWKDKHVVLEFEGVYAHGMVYINEQYAGGCPHGYTCFTVDMDPFIHYGEENTVKVMAKTHLDSRWYPGMGIYRGVNLLCADHCHIEPYGYRVTTVHADDRGAEILVETTVENRRPQKMTVSVHTVIRDGEGAPVSSGCAPLTIYGGETQKITQRFYIQNASLWSPDSPVRYDAESKLEADGCELDCAKSMFGIRIMSLDPVNGLRMNGKELKLRGACIHHDNGLIGAADIPRAEERRVQKLKEAGFNAVRSAHNPISSAFLDACDKYGVLVMDELTDMWTRRKGDWDYSMDFVSHWKELVDSIVAKDYNHPSVIMYSIGNEIPETGSGHGARIGRMLAGRLKELDPTRYTTNSVNLMLAGQGQVSVAEVMSEPGIGQAMNPAAAMSGEAAVGEDGGAPDINEIMNNLGPLMDLMASSDALGTITEETFSCVDIAGYNYATSRYEKDGKRYPDRIIVGSETFPKDIARNWELVKRLPYLLGDFTWTGWDYLGETGIGAVTYKEDGGKKTESYPWMLGWCGDLDITGFRRPVSYFREIAFGLRKDPYLAVRYPENKGKTSNAEQWSFVDGISDWTWTGHEGKTVEVEVYADAERVDLLVNGTLAASVVPEGLKALAEIEYQPGELMAVSYVNGKETGRYTVKTAGSAARLEALADRSVLRADDTDLCYRGCFLWKSG